MKDIIIFLTNWRRKSNLIEVIDSIKKQTIIPDIVLIDNASNDDENKFLHYDEKIEIINSDNSLMCWKRWETSFNYESKYICIMDDDLCFTRNDVLKNCFEYMENDQSIDAIGLEGVKLIKSKGYFGSNHQFAKSNHTIPVSIIKGRFMFVRSNSLLDVDMTPDFTCDDIKISSFLRKKILPSVLWNSFKDLPQGSEALSAKQYQHIKREYATKRYFKN